MSQLYFFGYLIDTWMHLLKYMFSIWLLLDLGAWFLWLMLISVDCAIISHEWDSFGFYNNFWLHTLCSIISLRLGGSTSTTGCNLLHMYVEEILDHEMQVENSFRLNSFSFIVEIEIMWKVRSMKAPHSIIAYSFWV